MGIENRKWESNLTSPRQSSPRRSAHFYRQLYPMLKRVSLPNRVRHQLPPGDYIVDWQNLRRGLQ